MPSKTRPAPPPSARQRIAANIRRLRKAKGFTQEELGEVAGFHRTYVSQLERRVANISIDGLEQIAQILEVDILDLLQTPE